MIKAAYRVRGLNAGNYPENREDEQFHINPRGDLIATQSLPELTELVRLGESWQVQTSTAIAALTAVPTTTAGFNLWNGEPTNGKCYAIDSIAVVEIVVDATQSDVTALFAGLEVNVAPVTDAGLTFRSCSGRTYPGRARTTANGTTGVTWYPHGPSSAGLAPAVAGSGWKVTEVPLRGMYLCPPGSRFSIHAVKVAGAASQCQFFMRWHEVQTIWKS